MQIYSFCSILIQKDKNFDEFIQFYRWVVLSV